VTKPDAFDPGIQRTYEELGRHYNTVIFPARPGKARDKAKVEVAVQVAQRWILARLRNETFFSLGELNGCLGAPSGASRRPLRTHAPKLCGTLGCAQRAQAECEY
jgi:transposase